MYLTLEQVKAYKTPIQRSPEWFSLRSQYLTSSDLGTVLGKNKYKTSEELFNEKTGISVKDFTENEAIKHGVKYEPEAIDMYCKVLGRTCYEIGLVPFDTFQDKDKNGLDCSFLAGSVDGITVKDTVEDTEEDTEEEGLNIIEVKCPLFRRIKYGVIPDYYYPQVQMNIHILNVRYGDYVEYVPTHAQGNKSPLLNIVRVYRDDDWLRSVYPELKSFWNSVVEERRQQQQQKAT